MARTPANDTGGMVEKRGHALWLSHALMIVAMTKAPAEEIAPFTYFEIVAGIIIGMVMFGTLPDGWAWAGMALIAVSGIAVKKLPGVLKMRRREKY